MHVLKLIDLYSKIKYILLYKTLKQIKKFKNKTEKVGSGVTLSIWFSAATLPGCVTFSESLNFSSSQFSNL